MATTLPAPPEQVWPWLVQWASAARAGTAGTGWTTPAEPSADRIVPEWQSLEVGQRLEQRVARRGQPWMTVAMVEPGRALVLRATAEMASCGPFDPRPARIPGAYLDGIWGSHLQPAPAAPLPGRPYARPGTT